MPILDNGYPITWFEILPQSYSYSLLRILTSDVIVQFGKPFTFCHSVCQNLSDSEPVYRKSFTVIWIFHFQSLQILLLIVTVTSYKELLFLNGTGGVQLRPSQILTDIMKWNSFYKHYIKSFLRHFIRKINFGLTYAKNTLLLENFYQPLCRFRKVANGAFLFVAFDTKWCSSICSGAYSSSSIYSRTHLVDQFYLFRGILSETVQWVLKE